MLYEKEQPPAISTALCIVQILGSHVDRVSIHVPYRSVSNDGGLVLPYAWKFHSFLQ